MESWQRHGHLAAPQRYHPCPRALLTAFLAGVLAAVVLGPVPPLQAALQQGGPRAEVLIGADDDNLDNPIVHPPGTAADQSLSNTDVLDGGFGNDIIIGLLGSDVLRGNFGHDILIGGTEQGAKPNSDIIYGDAGNDVNIWAPGDGSDAFLGGPGYDAMVFGVIDRDADNVPTLTAPVEGFPYGVPTANVSGSPGFCTIERVEDPAFGYQYLARFFVRSSGALAVTIRLAQVEQVFCTSQEGGQITYADLTQADPQFVVVSPEQVQQLNPIVALIIR
ncbi:MAG TPA: calcium-binding protein [Alphaproteobacteria bacterium]|nr:calcium-binding protein [Alphaproteobacteria bacterium]